jgi:hypothetical protein
VPTDREIDKALRKIDRALQKAPKRDQFRTLKREFAAQPGDLRRPVEAAFWLEHGIGPPGQSSTGMIIAAGLFTFLTIASLFFLILSSHDIPKNKHIVFDVWLAFSVAASFGFIGGTAQVQGKVPVLKNGSFLALGGFAAFLITLLIMYELYP